MAFSRNGVGIDVRLSQLISKLKVSKVATFGSRNCKLQGIALKGSTLFSNSTND
jgi:hypothetical protein